MKKTIRINNLEDVFTGDRVVVVREMAWVGMLRLLLQRVEACRMVENAHSIQARVETL